MVSTKYHCDTNIGGGSREVKDDTLSIGYRENMIALACLP